MQRQCGHYVPFTHPMAALARVHQQELDHDVEVVCLRASVDAGRPRGWSSFWELVARLRAMLRARSRLQPSDIRRGRLGVSC
jgi:hypothetical protein